MKKTLLAGMASVMLTVTVYLAASALGKDSVSTEPPAPTVASTRPALHADLPRMPGEFERQAGLVISAAQMVQFHPGLLEEIVAAAGSHIEVTCLVGGEQEKELVVRRLAEQGLAPGLVRFLDAPMMTMWIRDWGPIAVERTGGRLELVDPHYEGNGRNAGDDLAGSAIAADRGLPVRSLPLTMEGGDVLSNGCGLGLTSRRIVQRNARARGYDAGTVTSLLRSHLGFEDWFPLPALVGEPTGHVDMFATFVDSVTVVVGRYDDDVDPTNAALLDKVAAALDGFVTHAGTVKVERVDMPARPDEIWRSYTNVVYANGRVLVPQYPGHSADLDAEALALYRRLLPDREIVGIDCSDLILRNGALHCVTLNVFGAEGDEG